MTYANNVTARELALYAVNNADIYHQITAPVCRNLAKHKSRGVFDSASAMRSWERVAYVAARAYSRDHLHNDSAWKSIFPLDVRRIAAEVIRDHYASYVEELTA